MSMELGFSDVLVPEILRLRGDLSAGTSGKEERNVMKKPKFRIFDYIVQLVSFSPPTKKKLVCFKGTLHSISTRFISLSLWYSNSQGTRESWPHLRNLF